MFGIIFGGEGGMSVLNMVLIGKGSLLEWLASIFCDYAFLVEKWIFADRHFLKQLAVSCFYILEVILHFTVNDNVSVNP